MDDVILYALGANISFAIGIQVFTAFSRFRSSMWMNAFKGSVALICFLVSLLFVPLPSSLAWSSIGILVVSGFLGLGLGDFCLLSAFKEIGPSRSLMLFSFEPLMNGVLANVFLGQEFNREHGIVVFFMIFCVWILALESKKQEGNWKLPYLGLAFLGTFFDSISIILTRSIYDKEPELGVFVAMNYRLLGAVIFFVFYSVFIKKIDLWSGFINLKRIDKTKVLFGSILGTFLALGLYFQAIKTAHLASLSAIAITGILFSTILEHMINKKWPSIYFFGAFGSFLLGFYFL